ncbi:hypothetical protein [Vibrio rotiferianus]|uniref:hypothetical protein n=1 Tax=Vibrio rotiferianus TaxID=190895 RepID=UPI0038B41162
MKSIPELLLGLLVNHWVNMAVWLVLLALAAYGFFNQVTWLKSYLVYLKIYFYIQAPWIIPFFIDGVLRKILPFVKGGSEVLPWLLIVTYPTGIIAMLAWSLYLVVKK